MAKKRNPLLRAQQAGQPAGWFRQQTRHLAEGCSRMGISVSTRVTSFQSWQVLYFLVLMALRSWGYEFEKKSHCTTSSGIVFSERYGNVHHFELAGAPLLNGIQVPGVLHVFLKVLLDDPPVFVVKGFVFFETIETPQVRGSKYLAPDGVYNSLNLYVTRDDGVHLQNVSLSEVPSKRRGRLQGTPREFIFSLDCSDTKWLLSANTFTRAIHLASVLQQAELFNPKLPATAVKFLPTVCCGLSGESYFELLKASVVHHSMLGFSSTVLYARPADVVSLEVLPHFRELGKRGLRVIEWEPFSSPLNMSSGTFDFIIQMFHMGLSFWGGGSRILLTDLDEFLALPQGRQIGEELQEGGCLRNWRGALLPRYNVMAVEHSEEVKDFPDVFNKSNWDRARKRDGLGGIGAPLWTLNLRSKKGKSPKVLLQPKSQMMGFIHHAYCCLSGDHAKLSDDSLFLHYFGSRKTFSSTRKKFLNKTGMAIVGFSCAPKIQLCGLHRSSCAFVAHVSNMFRTRLEKDKTDTWQTDSSWLWYLN